MLPPMGQGATSHDPASAQATASTRAAPWAGILWLAVKLILLVLVADSGRVAVIYQNF